MLEPPLDRVLDHRAERRHADPAREQEAREGEDVAADELRRRQVGDIVTYVINRNVNFTNVCVKHCGFCAFSRTYRSEQGYFLPTDEILRRVGEAGTPVPMATGLGAAESPRAFRLLEELGTHPKVVYLREAKWQE